MKKLKISKINISFVVIFLFLFATTAYLYFVNLKAKPQEESKIIKTQPIQNTKHKIPTPQPTLIPYPTIPTSDKITMNGVVMDNFYYKALSIGPIGDTLFVNAKSYKITYFPIDKAFLISILGSPFQDVRKVAEQDFVNTLGISQTDACKLSVYITTPTAFNPSEAGKNYTLSFCTK